jgi:hypothetical protein
MAPHPPPTPLPGDPRGPADPWHRRYWGYYNRPYGGCGCLYAIFLVLLVYFIMSWAFRWPWFWAW